MVSEPSMDFIKDDFLATRFDGKNFALWEHQFRIHVQGKGLLPYLTGDATEPVAPKPTDDATAAAAATPLPAAAADAKNKAAAAAADTATSNKEHYPSSWEWMQRISDVAVIKESWPPHEKLVTKWTDFRRRFLLAKGATEASSSN
ncbi:hypothetical protein LINGRAHAP2_LOCUS31637 [Linum grandiflorum]